MEKIPSSISISREVKEKVDTFYRKNFKLKKSKEIEEFLKQRLNNEKLQKTINLAFKKLDLYYNSNIKERNKNIENIKNFHKDAKEIKLLIKEIRTDCYFIEEKTFFKMFYKIYLDKIEKYIDIINVTEFNIELIKQLKDLKKAFKEKEFKIIIDICNNYKDKNQINNSIYYLSKQKGKSNKEIDNYLYKK